MPYSDPVFINPLLGTDDAWSGYYVEFANDAADPQILAQLETSPLTEAFDHRHPWFLPAIGDAIGNSKLGDHAVPVFPAHPAPHKADELNQLEARLRQDNRKVALKASPENKLPGAGCWDYLLLASSHARTLPPFTLVGLSSRTVPIITDVHSHNDREWLVANAGALSTCEFLQARSPANSKADITRIKLLKLLALVAEDADTGALDTVFREEPKLSYSLLRLVNSAAMAPRSPITSFSQAINLLGRRQLQRWLQLLVYSDPNNGQHPNPLLQKAAARGRLLELLAARVEGSPAGEQGSDLAFMIGTFSLLDVLLNMAMPEILRQLPLPEIAQKALAANGGVLGELLAVSIAADRRELPLAARRLKALGISGSDYLDAQLAAYGWAEKIRPTA